MRWLTLGILVVLGAIAFACGGSSGDGLASDYAPNFVGTWSGDISATERGSTASTIGPASEPLVVVATGRNALEIHGVCSTTTGPAGRVTGPASFEISAMDCGTGTVGTCTSARGLVRGGSAVVAGGAMTLTMLFHIDACGQAVDIDVTYVGRRPGAPDGGFPDAGFPDAGFPDAGFPDAGSPDAGTPDAGPPPGASTDPGLAITALAHGVVDAEYSRSLDRLVTADGTTMALYVYDPATATESKVALPLAPQCLALSPDGSHALVGHDAWISYVDLSTATLVKKIPVSANIGDCVLAGNGWAYLFPKVDQWVAIHSVELATGVETLSPYASIYAGDHAVLTSDGTAMYTVTSGLSPANIDRWTVSGGAAVHAWASPYWGSYAMGPLLWTSADGARVFTSAGTAFRSSGAQAQDLQYNGTFMPGGVTWLDSSPTEVAAIPQVNPYAYPPSTLTDGTVEILGNEVLGHLDRIMLPRWQVGPYSYAVHGRFVFYGAGYAKKHVIVQADGASGLLHDTAVLTY